MGIPPTQPVSGTSQPVDVNDSDQTISPFSPNTLPCDSFFDGNCVPRLPVFAPDYSALYNQGVIASGETGSGLPLPYQPENPWEINLGSAASDLPRLQGRTILVIWNPASGGFSLKESHIVGPGAPFNAENIGAKEVLLHSTVKDPSANVEAIKARMVEVAQKAGQPIVVVAIGGDGTIIPVEDAYHRLVAEGKIDVVEYLAYPRKGTAGDKGLAIGAPTNLGELPAWIENSKLAAMHASDVDIVVKIGQETQTVHMRVGHNIGVGMSGDLFHRVEAIRETEIPLAQQKLDTYRNNRILQSPSLAPIRDQKIAEAEKKLRQAQAKSPFDYIRHVPGLTVEYLGQGFPAEITITRAGSPQSTPQTIQAAEVMIVNTHINGGMLVAPGVSPTLGSSMALVVVPPTFFRGVGAGTEGFLRMLASRIGINPGQSMLLLPSDHFQLLNPGDEFVVRPLQEGTKGQINGDGIVGDIVEIRGNVTSETIQVAIQPGSMVDRRQIYRGTDTWLGEQYVKTQGARVLASPAGATLLPREALPTIWNPQARSQIVEEVALLEKTLVQSGLTTTQVTDILRMSDLQFEVFIAHLTETGKIKPGDVPALMHLRETTAQVVVDAVDVDRLDAWLKTEEGKLFIKKQVVQEWILRHRYFSGSTAIQTLRAGGPAAIASLISMISTELGIEKLLECIGLNPDDHPYLKGSLFIPALLGVESFLQRGMTEGFGAMGQLAMDPRFWSRMTDGATWAFQGFKAMTALQIASTGWKTISPTGWELTKSIAVASLVGKMIGTVSAETGLVEEGSRAQHYVELGGIAGVLTFSKVYAQIRERQLAGAFIDGTAVRTIGNQSVVRGIPALTTDALAARAAGKVFVYVSVGGMALDMIGYGIIDYFQTDYKLSVRQRAHEKRLGANAEENIWSAWGSEIPYGERLMHTRDWIATNLLWNNISSWGVENSLVGIYPLRDYIAEVQREDAQKMEEGIRESLAEIAAHVIIANPSIYPATNTDEILAHLVNEREESRELREMLKFWGELSRESDYSSFLLNKGIITPEGALAKTDLLIQEIQPLIDEKLKEEMEKNKNTLADLECVLPQPEHEEQKEIIYLANFRARRWLEKNSRG